MILVGQSPVPVHMVDHPFHRGDYFMEKSPFPFITDPLFHRRDYLLGQFFSPSIVDLLFHRTGNFLEQSSFHPY